jgi:hypothetical protein
MLGTSHVMPRAVAIASGSFDELPIRGALGADAMQLVDRLDGLVHSASISFD